MTQGDLTNRRRPDRSRGFTLLEVILAAGFTAAACTAAMMLIKSISNTSATATGIGDGAASARNAIACMDLLVEQAELIGYRDSSRFLIWRNDDNQDGQINLLEVTLFQYDSATGNLDQVEVRFPPGTSSTTINQANVVLTTSQFVSGTMSSQILQYAQNVSVRRLLSGISQFRIVADRPGVAARMIHITFTVARADGSQVFHAAMTPRSPMWSMMP